LEGWRSPPADAKGPIRGVEKRRTDFTRKLTLMNADKQQGQLCPHIQLLTSRRGRFPPSTGREPMGWTIFAILIILWLLGWGFHVADGLIHLLLVVAAIVAVINLTRSRRTA